MIRTSIFTIVAFLLAITSTAANSDKPNLTERANAIVQSEETTFTVNSIGSGTTHVKARITILNENGLDLAKLYVGYDKHRKVEKLEGTSYDMLGKKIKSLKSKDILDVSAVSNGSLFEDNRMKVADLTHTSYPFTVEFEYRVTSTNMLFYPTWYPQDRESLSVAKAVFKVFMPSGTKLRYYEERVPTKVSQSSTGVHDIYTWEVNNLTPINIESYGPYPTELIPVVRTAPSDFEVDGYKGNMESWKALGLWYNQLNKGRDGLSEETKKKLQALVADSKTTQEKVERIYDYLQNRTRYVSIQLGIGGWQPFEANFVDTKGYGDCKALTNYAQAMLKAVGVESYHALIKAGENERDIITDFPSNQFNHVILSVPMESDTLWLECTSQVASAGYAGSFTGDRHALLVTPDGGKIVKTPHYNAANNAQKRTIHVKLTEKGDGQANVTTLYSGLQHDDVDQVLHGASPEDQRKWLYNNISIPAFEIAKFSFSRREGKLPEITENLELHLRQVANISGKRIFLTPNLMNKWRSTPAITAERKSEVVQSMAYLDIDTVVFELPVGYALEYMPKSIEHKTEFGTYKASIELDGQLVKYVRTLQVDKKRHKPESYAKFLEFRNQIIKADNQQVVFVKNIP